MKTTQKNLIGVFKEVKINVYSFNPETNARESAYCGVDILTALREIARRTAEGKKILLLDPSLDMSTAWEIENRGRIPYDICLPWVITGYKHPLFKNLK